MSISFSRTSNNIDKYFIPPQAGVAGMGYGNYTVPSCYGGDCTTLCGNPQGPYFHTTIRERLRSIYDDGVQGGSPACKKCSADVQNTSGLRPPFQTQVYTYALSYSGQNDTYRQDPYGKILMGENSRCATRPDSDYEALGHYVADFGCNASLRRFQGVPTYEQPQMIRPVPGMPDAKTLNSVAWMKEPAISGNVCTKCL